MTMMKPTTIYGKVCHRFLETLRSILLPFENQEVAVTVKRLTKRRSNPQNKYWWAVVIPAIRKKLLMQEMPLETREALTPLVVHQVVKIATGVSLAVPLPDGEAIIIEGRSRDKSTTEFKDFILETQEWAARTLGIYIPDPEEPGYAEWVEAQMAKEAIES